MDCKQENDNKADSLTEQHLMFAKSLAGEGININDTSLPPFTIVPGEDRCISEGNILHAGGMHETKQAVTTNSALED